MRPRPLRGHRPLESGSRERITYQHLDAILVAAEASTVVCRLFLDALQTHAIELGRSPPMAPSL